MRLWLLPTFFVTLSFGAALAASPLDGIWVPDLRFCGHQREDMIDSKTSVDNIVIKNSLYEAYEQSCRISTSDQKLTSITLRMACEGEGSRYQQSKTFHVIDENKVWIANPKDIWMRCVSGQKGNSEAAAANPNNAPASTPSKSPIERNEFAITTMIVATIETLTGQDTKNASLEVRISDSDVERKCQADPQPWRTVPYCVRAMKVLVGLSQEPGLDLNFGPTDVDARGFNFQRAQANCSLKELTVWRSGRQPLPVYALLQPGKQTLEWHEKESTKRVFDYYEMGSSPGIDYLSDAFAFLCPAETASIIKAELSLKRILRDKSNKVTCHTGGYTLKFPDGGGYDNKVGKASVHGFTYPEIYWASLSDRKRNYQPSTQMFSIIRDDAIYDFYCNKS